LELDWFARTNQDDFFEKKDENINQMQWSDAKFLNDEFMNAEFFRLNFRPPSNVKTTLKVGIEYYDTPCSKYDQDCLIAKKVQADFYAVLDDYLFFGTRNFWSILTEFVNVYGYEKWIVDTCYFTSLLSSLIPFLGIAIVTPAMLTLQAYYYFWPWFYLGENPDAFKWYNWVATPLLR